MENEYGDRTLSFKEILYIIKRHAVLEAVIVAIGVILGVVLALTNKDVYVASWRVSVKANIKQDITYNDTSLSKTIMPTIEDFISNDSVIIDKARDNSGYSDITAKNISTSNKEDSLIMTVSYSDSTEEGAIAKLKAIVNAAQEVVKAPNDDNGNSQMSKYFFAIIELEPVQSEPTFIRRNIDLPIIIISILMGMVLALIVSVLIYIVSDKVISEDSLERITGKKNMICVLGKRVKNEKETALKLVDLTQLSDSLIFTKGTNSSVVYQIQSTTHSEGKSTIATNLGITLAEAGRKTLIVDCDFRKRRIHKLLGIEGCADVMDYFKGEKTFDEVVNPSGRQNLDVITASSSVKNHTMVFTSEKFSTLLKEAKERYEFVLLDCGPVELISDYINISKNVDGTLLVVACNYIKSLTLKTTVSKLESCNANVIGTVFNFCEKHDYYQDYYQYNNL